MSAQPPPPGDGPTQPPPPGLGPVPGAGQPPPPPVVATQAATTGPGGVPPGGTVTWEVGDEIRASWEGFSSNPWPWLLGFVPFVVLVPLQIAFVFLADAGGPDVEAALVAGVVVFVLVTVLAGILVQLGWLRGSLAVADGHAVTWRMYVSADRLWPLVGAVLLVALGVMVGTVLCILPGIVFGVMATWTPLFVLDGRSPVAAVRASLALTRQRWADVLVVLVMVQVLAYAGMLALLVGLVVAVPVGMILQARVFRRMVANADLSGAPA